LGNGVSKYDLVEALANDKDGVSGKSCCEAANQRVSSM
jgi:hypothetical protein